MDLELRWICPRIMSNTIFCPQLKKRLVFSAGHKGRLSGETRSTCKGKSGGTVEEWHLTVSEYKSIYTRNVIVVDGGDIEHIQTFSFFFFFFSFWQNWKQRWFTLNRYELKYFKDKTVSPSWPCAPNVLLHFHLTFTIRFHLLQFTPDKRQEGLSWWPVRCRVSSVAVRGANPNPWPESLLCSPVRLLSGQS